MGRYVDDQTCRHLCCGERLSPSKRWNKRRMRNLQTIVPPVLDPSAYAAFFAFFSPWQSCAKELWSRDYSPTLSNWK